MAALGGRWAKAGGTINLFEKQFGLQTPPLLSTAENCALPTTAGDGRFIFRSRQKRRDLLGAPGEFMEGAVFFLINLLGES